MRASKKEFDFPQGQANAETVYDGKGGISLSGFWRKLVVAHESDGLRLFISGYFTRESRVLLHRNIIERVERLAPFLMFDRDPYIVADGDRFSYVIGACHVNCIARGSQDDALLCDHPAPRCRETGVPAGAAIVGGGEKPDRRMACGSLGWRELRQVGIVPITEGTFIDRPA